MHDHEHAGATGNRRSGAYLGAPRTAFAMLEARVIVASGGVVRLLVEAYELPSR